VTPLVARLLVIANTDFFFIKELNRKFQVKAEIGGTEGGNTSPQRILE
jgi:hypothetical protein